MMITYDQASRINTRELFKELLKCNQDMVASLKIEGEEVQKDFKFIEYDKAEIKQDEKFLGSGLRFFSSENV